MEIDKALAFFQHAFLDDPLAILSAPQQLKALGFTQSTSLERFAEFDEEDQLLFPTYTRSLWHSKDLYLFLVTTVSEAGGCEAVSVLLPNTAATLVQMVRFATQQENAREVTDEAGPMAALIPEDLEADLAYGRHWLAQAAGKAGLGLTIKTSDVLLPGDTIALALFAEAKPHLQLFSEADRGRLTGPGSRLHRAISYFQSIAMAHAPDIPALLRAAKAAGFGLMNPDTAGADEGWALDGGHGDNSPFWERTLIIQINREADCAFEFALNLTLTDDIPEDVVRATFFEQLGLNPDAPVVACAGGALTASVWAQNSLLGCYWLFLRR